MKKFLTNKKLFSAILILAIAFNFFAPITTSAQGNYMQGATVKDVKPVTWGGVIGWFASEALLQASGFISTIMGAFFGVLLYLEALIIDYLLSPNFKFTTAPVVKFGWNITRDLANMFFILILLIIAFATVLRIQSYALQQLLWKVIVAALLINFSLVIAGTVIDFTQILTNFFVNGITANGNFGTFTAQLALNMKITNFYQPASPNSIGQGIAQFGASAFAAVVGMILTLVGGVVMVFVFGATAIFLVLRIINLWGLLIFAPIAWIFWILPATSGHFKEWWDSFIKWAFFAPIYTFFIFLARQIFNAAGGIKNGTFPLNQTSVWNQAAPGLTEASMPSAIFQWILVIAIMFYALIYAKKFGVMGADTSYKTLKGWGDKSKGWAGRQMRRGALAVGAQKAEVDAQGNVIKPARPGWLQRGAETVAALPGGKLLTGAVFKQVEAEAKSVEDAQKQFAGWTPEATQNYLSTKGGTPTSRLGAALALKDKGKLGDLGEDKVRELVALAARYSSKNVDKLLEVAPRLATEFGKDVKAITAKIEKASEIMLESLSDEKVVMNLNPEQLKNIAQKAKADKVRAVRDAVEIAYNNSMALDPTLEMHVEQNITNEPGKEKRNAALRQLAEDERNGVVPVGTTNTVRTKINVMSPAWET